MKSFPGEILGSDILRFKWSINLANLAGKRGVACLGVTAACNCSEVNAFKVILYHFGSCLISET